MDDEKERAKELNERIEEKLNGFNNTLNIYVTLIPNVKY